MVHMLLGAMSDPVVMFDMPVSSSGLPTYADTAYW